LQTTAHQRRPMTIKAARRNLVLVYWYSTVSRQ